MPGYSSRSEEHTSELQSQSNLVCRLLLEKKKLSYDCSNYEEGEARGQYYSRYPRELAHEMPTRDYGIVESHGRHQQDPDHERSPKRTRHVHREEVGKREQDSRNHVRNASVDSGPFGRPFEALFALGVSPSRHPDGPV